MRRRRPSTDPAALVKRSIRRYRRRHRHYERLHPEIFNPREQQRLREALAHAVADLGPVTGRPARALDLGCGSGNLTRHLLDLGLEVLAADVSPHFLMDVERRFGRTGRLRTLRVNGIDLAPIESGSLDIACAYSVLHHIPDYAAAIEEMCRVVRPGGLVYLDHEANEAFYEPGGCFQAMLRELHPPPSWCRRALTPATYLDPLRRLVNPHHPWDVEGDIHVWEFDRIEWPLVEACLERGGCEIVDREEYLNYSSDWPEEVWQRYAGSCTNMRRVVARRYRSHA